MYADFLDLTQPLVWTVDNALSLQECRQYIDRMREQEQRGAVERAPIVGLDGAPVLDLPTRNNTRVMWDSESEANALLDKVRQSVPPVLSQKRLYGANPRLRLYRYQPGERHGAHWDTVVELEDNVCSLLTLVFYLNEDFTGGTTEFSELGQSIVPRAGRALLFQHRVLHVATTVTEGEKFVLRTDVLYRPD
jgi:predicted 2-oxoglutarate/Fe(II)-dependent dioxygenase YbiX